jgi:hypothetical protein
MRGSIMRLFTEAQHKQILSDNLNDRDASLVYSTLGSRFVSPQLVKYWRTIFIYNEGNMAKADRELKADRVLIKAQPDDDIGNTSFIPAVAECVLVIPDIHAPYQHPDTIPFLMAVREWFSPDLVVDLGDELDYHAMSFHDSDPNLDSAGVELEKGKEFLNELYKVFPQVLVCHSNHGSMQFRRAKAHGIPVQLIKKYRDVIFPSHGAPQWSWAHNWRINTPMGEVLFKHQASGILSDAAHNSCNLVVGHSHGNFSVEYSASSSHLYYGMYCGCLIDKDSMAFAYGKHSLRKPIIGCAVILYGRPILLPMVLDKGGRWIGRL